MKSFRLEGGLQSVKNFIIGAVSLGFWGFIIIGGLSLLFGGDSSSVSSGGSGGYSGGYPYVDDYDYYDDYEPAFDDYREYIEADSVEACSDSGCYELDADVSDGEVNTIYFDNGGYRELDADFDEDGYGYGYGSAGDEWEIRVDEDDIEEARERYLEDQDDYNDDYYDDYDYYR